MKKQERVQSARFLIGQAILLVLVLMGLLVVAIRVTEVYAASINVDDEGFDSPTCGIPEAPCRTIPYALVRAQTGDTVFVWAGTYTETVALRAGIVISGAGATRTFIDGEGLRGPMVRATDGAIDASTVVRGVTVRRGMADNGGGIYITNGASPLIEDCIVSENVATSRGGGLYVFETALLTLRDTVVISNTSSSSGGGMYQDFQGASRLDLFGGRFENNETTGGNGGGLWIANTVVLSGTEFINNRAAGRGGGLFQSRTTGRAELIGGRLENNRGGFYGGGLSAEGTAVLSGTEVVGNSAGDHGGGVWTNYAEVSGAVLVNNRSDLRGGGLFAEYGVVMTGTTVISNTAPQQGGGVATHRHADIVNSVFARNSAYAGAAVWMWGSSAVRNELRHLTIMSPTVGSAYPNAAAILVHDQTTAMITNTIVGGYPYAVEAYNGGTVYEDYNLYHDIGTTPFNQTGGAVHSGGHSLYDLDPHFLDPSADDYHLGAGSAGIKAGIDIGVTEDIEGDPRVPGLPPDIGADETVPILGVDKSGPAWSNAGTPITYTLVVTNTGVVTAYNVVLTDTLPAGASLVAASDGGFQSDGEVSWPPFDVPPGGGVVTRALSVAAIDTITNDDYAAAAQGYPGVAGVTAVTTVMNHPPTADAGEPQTVHAGTVILDGSGSSDPDGDDLLYEWVQTGGTPVTLSDSASPRPSFSAPNTAGELTFMLTVTDPFGLEDSDTTTVTIVNHAPTADAGEPQTVHAGTVTLDGSGSSDPDGDNLLYEWVQTGGTPVTLSDSTSPSPSFSAPTTAGELTFTLTVTDPFGSHDSDTTTVTIINAAPVADAGPSQTVHAGTVVLDGSGSSDPDGDNLLYEWVQTGGTPVTLSDSTSPSPSFSAPTTAGELTFTLTVTDPFGSHDSDATTVTIINAAPVADAGPTQQALPGTSVILDGSESFDPDGDDLLYEWVQTGGTPVALSSANSSSSTFTSPNASATLTFTLTVTDPFDLSDTDSTTVTITLPELAISKSGPDGVMADDLITYTLMITNNAPIAASSLVITDAVPTEARLIKASDNGLLVRDIVSWTVTSLGPGESLTRTFAVTATETITNSHYGVLSGEGVSAEGNVAVVTKIEHVYRVYLPAIARGFEDVLSLDHLRQTGSEELDDESSRGESSRPPALVLFLTLAPALFLTLLH